MAESGIVEFYITCNPPLLALGVKDLVESVKLACQDELLEILHEPDIPWFKCITMAEHQHKIADTIQYLMHDLLDAEVEQLKFNAIEDIDVEEGYLHPDVLQKVPENPRVMAWLLYKALGEDIYDTFADHQFPVTMANIPYKSTWRGLQNSSGVPIDTLLSAFSLLSKSKDAPITVHDFAFSTNCEISYNLRGELIYIGSWESMETVEKTVRKLNSMLNLLASKPQVASHILLLEGQASVRLTFKWMSHVGLARATFATPSGDTDIATEYKLLSNAAIVRTETLDRHGRWIPDTIVYPLKDAPPAEAEPGLVAFKGYVPPTKKRGAKIRLLHESEVVKEPKVMSPARTETLSPLREPVQSDQMAHRDAPANSLKLTSPVPAYNDQSIDHHQDLVDDQELLAQPQPPASALLSPELPSVEAVMGSMRPLANTETELVRNHRPSAAGSCILDWEEEIHSQFTMSNHCKGDLLISQEDGIQPQFPLPKHYEGDLLSSQQTELQPQFTMSNDCEDELLISLDEPGEGTLSGSGPAGSEVPSTVTELQELNDRLVRLEQFKSSNDDLICLDYDEPPTQTLTRAKSVWGTCDHDPIGESNPLEAQEIDLTSRTSDGSLSFGLMKEEPREMFRTMKQKGGRAINPSGKAAPSPKGNSSRARQAPTKRSQSIQSSTRRNSSTPTGPKQKPEFDSDFPALVKSPKSPKKHAPKPLLYADAAKLPNTPRSTTGGPLQRPPPRFPGLGGSSIPPAWAPEPEGKLSKEPKLENNHEKDGHLPQEKSDILKEAEQQLKRGSQILELAPGYVSLEVVFGRVYIKKMAPGLVDHSGSGPTHSAEDVLGLLNGTTFRQDCIGFSPILSTSAGDANTLANITPSGESPWHLYEKETWFDLECVFYGPKGEEPVIVELNADNYQYRVRGQRQDFFAIYLHCPQRAWDMKACGVRATALTPEHKLKCFVKDIVNQMDILADEKGKLRIQYPDYGRTREIESITMRQVARYRHGKKRDSSVLTVTMTYSMEESSSTDKTRGAERLRVFACPKSSMNSALPHQHVVASITSSRLSRYLDKNVKLEYGDKAAWDADQLESENVFEDMLRPAFGMISHMDHIGSSNDTMRDTNDLDAIHDALVESDAKKKKWAFW
ncbi:hypothetical protein BBK36DRAFT_6805 [Trichoderma citrinoviride]|uniref:Uncharacterized protein n=1 Tax=Trichoderma citrinoviride TaxID=58853 RepID=A0A2T4B5E7_9HYPO|nr:hypothetical protein BBK36DRAFT_6805 [Trichoderma citrinoviride]PTB64469.1 hypothetical protein BBK36DRAFT_6805 [Trichoderma citrinoviride]